MTLQIIGRMSAGPHTLTVNRGRPTALSRYFTVTPYAQGIRADRPGEFLD